MSLKPIPTDLWIEVTAHSPTHPDESRAYCNRCVDGSYCTLTQMSLKPIVTGVRMEVTVHSPR